MLPNLDFSSTSKDDDQEQIVESNRVIMNSALNRVMLATARNTTDKPATVLSGGLVVDQFTIGPFKKSNPKNPIDSVRLNVYLVPQSEWSEGIDRSKAIRKEIWLSTKTSRGRIQYCARLGGESLASAH
ncbi:MAG: hypothetical protein R2827_02000 [Bdellovibrionales bacterium]